MNREASVSRALYIVLVPLVVLIIILNSGHLQRFLTAATVNDESFNVVHYNFYYFDYYNQFLEDNYDILDELGYDSDISNGQQDYDDEMTWRDYFLLEGEADLARAVYYTDLAEEAGYEYTEEDLLGIELHEAADAEIMDTYSLSAKNYYISYYGRGMKETAFMTELTRKVQGEAYKEYLIDIYEASDEEVEAYIAENEVPDYQTVNLSIITLDAYENRSTGQVGETQLEALRLQLEELAARYEAGESFDDLQSAFSTTQLGSLEGILTDATQSDLPEVMWAWAIDEQDALTAGDTFYAVDEESGIAYFAVFDGYGADGAIAQANQALGTIAVEAAEAEALSGDYAVVRNKLGMTLAAN